MVARLGQREERRRFATLSAPGPRVNGVATGQPKSKVTGSNPVGPVLQNPANAVLGSTTYGLCYIRGLPDHHMWVHFGPDPTPPQPSLTRHGATAGSDGGEWRWSAARYGSGMTRGSN